MTLSVEHFTQHDYAVDYVLSVSGATATNGPAVHASAALAPSVLSASRQFVTSPGFACGVFAGAGRCHALAVGRWTWSSARVTAFDATYAPFADAGFALPSALWLHEAENYQGAAFRALVGAGGAPALAFRGSRLFAVERRGDRLALAVYRAGARELAEERVQALGVARALAVPESTASEPSYAAEAVKWGGPWGSEYVLLAAADLRGEYAGAALAL